VASTPDVGETRFLSVTGIRSTFPAIGERTSVVKTDLP
jgi:hypothetical protein